MCCCHTRNARRVQNFNYIYIAEYCSYSNIAILMWCSSTLLWYCELLTNPSGDALALSLCAFACFCLIVCISVCLFCCLCLEFAGFTEQETLWAWRVWLGPYLCHWWVWRPMHTVLNMKGGFISSVDEAHLCKYWVHREHLSLLTIIYSLMHTHTRITHRSCDCNVFSFQWQWKSLSQFYSGGGAVPWFKTFWALPCLQPLL